MKRNLFYLTVLGIFLLFLVVMLLNPLLVTSSMRTSLKLWQENLFPSLFPFLVLGEILIHLGLPTYLSYFTKTFMNKVFSLSGNASFLMFMSMISGFPSGAKYTKSLYEKKMIEKEEANHLLTLVHFSNPLFILGTVAFILKNNKVTHLVLASHFLSNLLLAFFTRRENSVSKRNEEKLSIKRIVKEKSSELPLFLDWFLDAVQSAIQTMLFMLGSVSFFFLLSKLVTTSLDNQIIKSSLTGLLDLTSGIFSLQTKDLSLFIKGLFANLFLTFGSFSVHLQVLNVLKDTDLSYFSFLKGRVKASFIAIILYLLLFSYS